MWRRGNIKENKHNGLNVYPESSYVEILSPTVMVWGGGRWLGHEGKPSWMVLVRL